MKLRNRRSYHSSMPFVDLLFNTLLGFFFLYVMAFLMVNVQTKQADIKTKAEYIITVSWNEGVDDDVDTWLEDPLGNKLFFRKKEIAMAHLDRDDLGGVGDTIRLPDGSEVKYTHNQEITTIRGFIPGEWILNIHLFRRGNGSDDKTPISVVVKMEKLNPKVTLSLLRTIVLTDYWQEETVSRFTMAASGDILEWSKLYKKVIRDGNDTRSIIHHPTDDNPNRTERSSDYNPL